MRGCYQRYLLDLGYTPLLNRSQKVKRHKDYQFYYSRTPIKRDWFCNLSCFKKEDRPTDKPYVVAGGS